MLVFSLHRTQHLHCVFKSSFPFTNQSVQEMRPDEYGVEELVTVLKPAPLELYSKNDVYVPAPVARILRPHQREGVQFIYECVMGLKDYRGRGVILADGA
jgi:hypothetical protein